MDADQLTVVDDTEKKRFVVDEDGVEAELAYRLDGDRLVLVHTEVPEAFRGRGIAGQLVAAAADRALAEDLTVVPRCPYARKWLEDHPEAVEGLAIDWATES